MGSKKKAKPKKKKISKTDPVFYISSEWAIKGNRNDFCVYPTYKLAMKSVSKGEYVYKVKAELIGRVQLEIK
jgi:hypothetical protein